MNRRQFLVASSAGTTFGLAGCVNMLTGASSQELEVRIADVFDSQHAETGLTFDIEVVSTVLDTETLPAYDVTLSNTGDTTYKVMGWSTTLFETISDPRGLQTISEGTAEAFMDDPPEQVHPDGCFTTEYVAIPAVDRSETMEPDDERTDRTYVVGAHDAFDGDCIEPGEYTMIQTHSIRKPRYDEDGNPKEPESKPSFEWGVTFAVSEA